VHSIGTAHGAQGTRSPNARWRVFVDVPGSRLQIKKPFYAREQEDGNVSLGFSTGAVLIDSR
jgi:hypothetical protein